MTPRQRVLAVLRGEPPDKVPFTIYESKIPQCALERRLRNEGLCIVNRHWRGYTEQTPNCTRQTVHYSQAGRARVRTVLRTPVGELSTLAEPVEYTSWTLEHLFQRPEDYAVLRFIERDRVFSPAWEEAAEAGRRLGEDVILRGGVGACPLHHIMIHLMGVETFAVEWAERRDEVLALESLMRENLRKVYPLVAGAPATHANFGGNEVPEVMGPGRYREYCLPLFEEAAAVLHPAGKLLGSHLDGNNRPWAADVAGSSLDYVEAFTPAPDTDMSLADALNAWPDKVLWINFPSSVHLAPLEEVRRTARQIVDLACQSGRVILGITEDMPPDRWQENLLAISEAINAEAAGLL